MSELKLISDSETPDVKVHGEQGMQSSIFLFEPQTIAGRSWLERNTSDDSTWLGNSLAVENRYAVALAQAALDDGLVVR